MDLIDRQAAIDVLAEMQGQCTTKAALTQNSKIWKQIKKLPAAEPEREEGKTMRLINADAIHYDILLKTGYKEHPLEWAVSRSRIDSMPTIDAVEVVRCKDCKHRYGNACD